MKWMKVQNTGSSIIKVKNHTAVCYGNGVYVYGGFDGMKHKNCLNVFDLATHSLNSANTTGDLPSGRNGHTATLHGADIYIIGGWNSSNSQTTKEIFVLHLNTLAWEKIDPIGEPMVSCNMHSANLHNDKIYVFRGGDGTNYLNDLHFFDIIKKTWNSVANKGFLPSPRANHASAVFDRFLYIFGGWNGVDRLNDMFKFAFESGEWEKVWMKGNIPRPRAGMSLNAVTHGVMMFGGSGVSSASYNDLYFFDVQSSTWNECIVEGDIPSARAGHTLTSMTSLQLVLIGGSSGSQYADSWFILDIKPAPLVPQIIKHKELAFSGFCNNPQFSDIQFIIEEKIVYAHKIIITQLSEYLLFMFTSKMREASEQTVEIQNIRYPVFMILLKYLYSGEPEIGAGTEGQEMSVDFLIEILQAADRFLIDPIRIKCEVIISERVNKENVYDIVNAVENTRTEFLKEYCSWFIDVNC
jgi:N-acetylneuraminic acid mutarotase